MDFTVTMTLPEEGGYVDVHLNGQTIRSSTRHDGTAPSSGELFLAGLAACVGGNINEYCLVHGYPPPESVEMQTSFNLETQRSEVITTIVRFPAAFPEERLAAVKRVIDTCDVKQAWKNPPEFHTQMQIG